MYIRDHFYYQKWPADKRGVISEKQKVRNKASQIYVRTIGANKLICYRRTNVNFLQ